MSNTAQVHSGGLGTQPSPPFALWLLLPSVIACALCIQQGFGQITKSPRLQPPTVQVGLDWPFSPVPAISSSF